MRLLMIAPQPFFEPRGAPLCVNQHIQALLELGYEIDLVTYPLGQNLAHPNLHIYRAPSIPFMKRVKPGPSLAKIPLDLAVLFTTIQRLRKNRYHYICAHEEAALIGTLLASIFECKLLYYMHCNLAELISQNSLIFRCAESVQRFMVRKADAVVAFYPLLVATVKQMAPRTPTYLILPPAVDEGLPEPAEEAVTRLRQELRLTGGPVLLYTGTLENYQGLHLLLLGAHRVKAQFPDVRYLIVGGKPHQVKHLRTLAQQLGVNDFVQIIGSRPLAEMPSFMALADILLSPRNQANHVPLKLYSYLHSARAHGGHPWRFSVW